MDNPSSSSSATKPLGCGSGFYSPKPESRSPHSCPLSLPFVWIGLLALLACNVALAQATAGAGEEACAFNNTCGSGKPAPTTPPAPANPAAAKAAQQWNAVQNNLKNNQQMINNAGNAILNNLNSARSNNDGDSVTPPTDDSANIAPDSPNPGVSEVDFPAATPTPAPSSSAAVNALLDSDQPPNSSAAAVSALLGDGTQPGPAQPATGGTTTANAVANLLDDSKVSDSASAFSLPIPADPEINAVFQESADQPEQSQGGSLGQMLQSAGQQANDAISGLVTSGHSLVNSLTNDRIVQWMSSDQGNFTTAPLPISTDTPDTVGNLASGQAVVGFGDILKGYAAGVLGGAKGLYSYGAKMINQMGADLGFANSNILNDQSGNQN
jgi:hypothetical protein